MYDCSEWILRSGVLFVWGRAPSPVQAERSSAATCGRSNPGFAIAAIVVVALGLNFTTQAQSTPAAEPKPPAKSAAIPNQNAQPYRNTTFGFRYQVPYGWVERTKEMQAENETGKGDLLLAVFERPPEATADTINSAVVIAAERAASYPGLKRAEDYLGPLTEVATAKGFKSDGEPYALDVESRQLLRADFTKIIHDKLTMRQCTLVLLAKGQIVSFTFIAGSEDELDDLMDGLHFVPAKPSAH
ncbi:MAG: hypothetical protein ABSD64_03590 [Terriglobales bacterium]|jgi:hypothetical protein